MFQIDRFGRKPIYEQIIEQVEQLVASGALQPNDQLPSVRTLSQTLSANPNTLQKAYAELERRGITTSVPGSGRYISKDASKLVSEGMTSLLDDVGVLCARLRQAGIAKQKVLDVIETTYRAAKQTDAKAANSTTQSDTSKDVSRKDTQQ